MSRNFLCADIDNIIVAALKTHTLFSSARMFKVPEDLRKLNEIAYTPRIMAIGPLHRDKAELRKTMQDIKMYYTFHLIARQAKEFMDVRKVLEEYIKEMEEHVDEAKKYYAANLRMEDNEIAQMMVVDGCFILELLYASYLIKKSKEAEQKATNGGNSKDGSKGGSCGGEQQRASTILQREDPILNNILTAKIVKQDLLLLENQIPFFVLEKFFKLTLDTIPNDDDPITGNSQQKLSLTEYILSYFEDIMFPQGVNNGGGSTSDTVLLVSSSTNEIEQGEKGSPKANDDCYYHILHLLHSVSLPVENKKHSGIKLSDLRISASDLDYAGVKLVADQNRSLFNITFQGSKFEIPIIRIHGSTETFLRNLIVFEQCCPWLSKPYFTSYAMFMDLLINSEKDVQVLKNAGVIVNYLGTDKDVFELFNNLCKEVVTGDFYFSEVCQQAFDFTERSWWPMFIAYLKRTYFDSPWGFIGFCLAFVAFGMQVIQFIYGFLKY